MLEQMQPEMNWGGGVRHENENKNVKVCVWYCETITLERDWTVLCGRQWESLGRAVRGDS